MAARFLLTEAKEEEGKREIVVGKVVRMENEEMEPEIYMKSK